MGKREFVKQIKIMAPAGAATPGPPLGPALGANGVNPGMFVKQFNEATQAQKGMVVGCIIKIFSDRSFEFIIKASPASALIKKAAGLDKGSGKPNSEKVGKLTMAQVSEIAKTKMEDLNAGSMEAACRIIAGTARSMGVTVVD